MARMRRVFVREADGSEVETKNERKNKEKKVIKDSRENMRKSKNDKLK